MTFWKNMRKLPTLIMLKVPFSWHFSSKYPTDSNSEPWLQIFVTHSANISSNCCCCSNGSIWRYTFCFFGRYFEILAKPARINNRFANTNQQFPLINGLNLSKFCNQNKKSIGQIKKIWRKFKENMKKNTTQLRGL
jgi:hypothetical protein